jgi:hypothetical protein
VVDGVEEMRKVTRQIGRGTGWIKLYAGEWRVYVRMIALGVDPLSVLSYST